MSSQVAVRQSLVEKFAMKYSIEPGRLMSILKATAFKVSQGEVSNEQMAALLVVADQYGLNPFTREIFAFEDRFKGIVPVVSVDGWSRIINDHKGFNGLEFNTPNPDGDITAPDGGKKAFSWIECVMYHKEREHPIPIKEYFDEVYQGPRGNPPKQGPWQTHPKRMHRHKALIQAARIAFGFSGIYDEDEAQRIVEAGGGIAVPLESGDRAVEGELQARTRTDGLASELAGRARDVVDAKVVTGGGNAEERKSSMMSAQTIFKTLGDVEVEDEVHALLPHIQALPNTPERAEIMRKWNTKVMSFKQVGDPSEVPAAFAGKTDAPSTQAATAPVKAKAPAPKPTAKPSTPVAPAAQTPGFAPSATADLKPTEADVEKVVIEMSATKDTDALDLIADRENKRAWTVDQRRKIYETYTNKREALTEGSANG